MQVKLNGGVTTREEFNIMDFPEYRGWSNEATWFIFTNFIRDRESHILLKEQAQEGTQQVQAFVEKLVQSWYEGTASETDVRAVRHLGRAVILSAVRRVRWAYIYDVLRGETVPDPPNELTRIAYEVLSTQNWQEVIEGASYDMMAIDLLSRWFETHCRTWAGISDSRKSRGHIAKFTIAALDIYMESANWDEVVEVLRAE
jgi:hypothetical protein